MSYDNIKNTIKTESNDIIKSATEGAAKGAVEAALNWGTDRIKDLASKFRDKKLAFIQDERTIEIVKQQYGSGELAFYRTYIEDKDILFLLKMGLTLRKLENDMERRRNLRTKLLNRYKLNGLHIAQFVENGILNRYIGILIDNMNSIDDFKRDVMEVLNNIQKYVLFVKSDDKEKNVIKNATTLIVSHSSMIFIISGISSAAKIVRKCEDRLIEFLKDYSLEKISSENIENLFFKRKISITE